MTAAAALCAACNATNRYRVLSTFFDGVPPPKPVEVAATQPAHNGLSEASRKATFSQHGPYAAKMCDACHNARSTNALIAHDSELCLRCHDFGAPKKFIHGPLASGGCLACHSPHSSSNRYLLRSATGEFCLDCHDRAGLSAVPGHADTAAACTSCHDAHMSDRRFLLR